MAAEGEAADRVGKVAFLGVLSQRLREFQPGGGSSSWRWREFQPDSGLEAAATSEEGSEAGSNAVALQVKFRANHGGAPEILVTSGGQRVEGVELK